VVSKKSAAKLKLAEKQEPEHKLTQEELQEHWNEYQRIEEQMLESMLDKAHRIDTYHDLREEYRAWYGSIPSHVEVLNLQGLVCDILEQMLGIVDGFTLEQFQADEIDDPYKDICVRPRSGCTETQCFHAWILWQLVRPFGERVVALHGLVLRETHGDTAD